VLPRELNDDALVCLAENGGLGGSYIGTMGLVGLCWVKKKLRCGPAGLIMARRNQTRIVNPDLNTNSNMLLCNLPVSWSQQIFDNYLSVYASQFATHTLSVGCFSA